MARTIDSPRQKTLRDFLVEKRKEAGLRQVDLAKRLKRRQDYARDAIKALAKIRK